MESARGSEGGILGAYVKQPDPACRQSLVRDAGSAVEVRHDEGATESLAR
jgi:hypothetical protein